MRRRRLGAELRQLREASDLTIDRVAASLGCSPSRVSRIESGQTIATSRDIKVMLDLYSITGDQRERLTEIATAAREKRWWQAYTDSHIVPLVGLEDAATFIRIYEGLVVPGLFQTTDYAEAVLRTVRSDLPLEQIERWVELRMARRRFRVGHADSPEIAAVLDEGMLRRPVGGRHTMRRQLEFLAEVADAPSVTLQVLPFSAGEHAAMSGSFMVFEFSDEMEADVVYLEHLTSDLYLEDDEELKRYIRVFEELRAQALTDERSKARFRRLAKDI